MLFHRFASQEERRAFGGSDFLELQYCCLPASTTPEELVSIYNIDNWKNESLYVYGDDMALFYDIYGWIFRDGLYNNLSRGPMDLCGINYYSPAQTAQILARVQAAQPVDYEPLLNWLQARGDCNGIYLLGV